MRTSVDEAARIGAVLGGKLSAATGPVALYLPRGGFSAVDRPDGPFWHPAADAACIAAVLDAVAGSAVEVVDDIRHVNDADLARSAADHLHRLVQEAPHGS